MSENTQPEITLDQDDAGGRYAIALGDGSEAEMTFRRTAPDIIAIDHTFVPPAWRNHGLAERLVRRAVEDARENGFRITPVCSYVVAQFRRHPEWADLKA